MIKLSGLHGEILHCRDEISASEKTKRLIQKQKQSFKLTALEDLN